jgi:hypothetical protein
MPRLLAVLAVLAAASAHAADLEIIDRDNFFPSARLSFDIGSWGERPSVPHSGHGIELGVSGVSGEGKQNLRASDSPVVFGERTFPGGSELRHEFDLRFVELAYRFRHFFNPDFGIEALGGLGYAELEITTTSPLQSAREKLGNGGLVGGFGVLWQFAYDTGLQSRLMLFASGQEEGVTAAGRLDVYIVQSLGRHAALRAGLVSWGVGSIRSDAADSSSTKSPISAGFAGIALGLDLMF